MKILLPTTILVLLTLAGISGDDDFKGQNHQDIAAAIQDAHESVHFARGISNNEKPQERPLDKSKHSKKRKPDNGSLDKSKPSEKKKPHSGKPKPSKTEKPKKHRPSQSKPDKKPDATNADSMKSDANEMSSDEKKRQWGRPMGPPQTLLRPLNPNQNRPNMGYQPPSWGRPPATLLRPIVPTIYHRPMVGPPMMRPPMMGPPMMRPPMMGPPMMRPPMMGPPMMRPPMMGPPMMRPPMMPPPMMRPPMMPPPMMRPPMMPPPMMGPMRPPPFVGFIIPPVPWYHKIFGSYVKPSDYHDIAPGVPVITQEEHDKIYG